MGFKTGLLIGGLAVAVVALGIVVFVLATEEESEDSTTGGAKVLVGKEYKPEGRWCPTLRTCFSRLTWITYDAEQAKGYGPAKECAGGGLGCQQHPSVTVEFSKPRNICGRERFTRLVMFGNAFELRTDLCINDYQLVASSPPAQPPPPKSQTVQGGLVTPATYQVDQQVWRTYPGAVQLAATKMFLRNNPQDCADEQGLGPNAAGFLKTVWLAGNLPEAELASDALLYFCTQLPTGVDY